MLELSKHASRRCQQRAIPPFILKLLMQFGSSRYSHGAKVYYLDKAGRKRVRRHLGKLIYGRLEDQLDRSVVAAADGTVVTAYNRVGR